MANTLDKDFKTMILQMLKELQEDVEKVKKEYVNKMELAIKRRKTYKEIKKKF